jgi:hypothetical protein
MPEVVGDERDDGFIDVGGIDRIDDLAAEQSARWGVSAARRQQEHQQQE